MGRVLILLVRLYQRCVSPWLPPACRFQPTCSQYMIEAIRARGAVRGVGLGLWRICRCHPFSRGGWDPVPGTESQEHAGASPPAERET